MNSYKKGTNLVGWLTFAITAIVLCLSVERTGSLWDCGEFVSGCYKLQVVHPPGAPLFLMIGKMATVIGQLFSNDPSVIAFSVNIMSGLSTALAGMFVCWTTMILGKIALTGREEEPDQSQFIALAGAGLVSGLCTAFASSIWFSAVEGEVYAMSSFFTAIVFWAILKWEHEVTQEKREGITATFTRADRWLILIFYLIGLSIGVQIGRAHV